MPRLFSNGAAMAMKRFSMALGLFLVVAAPGARADDAPPAGCSVGSTNILAVPDTGDAKAAAQVEAKGDITINCSGLTEAFGNQLAEVLTRILQNRLDPQAVMAKLDEVARIPEAGVARTVDDNQRQLIIQSLAGKPAGQIEITAHAGVADSAEFAKAIAAPLVMVGWKIAGHQIERAAPKALDPVHGVAVVVRDTGAAPQNALLLEAALTAAHITTLLVSDPALPPDAIRLWIGRRPEFMQTEPAK
jgi:hypothetical protein